MNLPDGQRLAWLRRVARNKLVDHSRRVSRHPVAPLQELAETVADNDLSPEQQALFQESLGLLQQEIAALPRLQQEVLRLRFGHGLPTKDSASMLQRTDTAIRLMLSRRLNRGQDTHKRERS